VDPVAPVRPFAYDCLEEILANFSKSPEKMGRGKINNKCLNSLRPTVKSTAGKTTTHTEKNYNS